MDPGSALGARARSRPRLLGELVVIAVLLVAYDWVRGRASVREPVALAHGREILHLEAGLHLDVEPVANAWLTSHRVLMDLAAGWYQYAHVTVALSVLAAAYIWHPSAYPRARNALVLTNVVGLAVFALCPTAPPRLLPHAGFFDSISRVFGSTSAHSPVSPDQYAALPSLHLAWATWVAVVGGLMVRRRWLRRALWLYPATTGLVVIATGNHYVVDVVTGIALGLWATWVTGALSSRAPAHSSARPSRR